MIDNSKALRIAGGGIMFVAGLLLAVVFRQEASLPEVLLHNIGIAGTVTGCVVAFREIILSPPTKEDLRNCHSHNRE